MVLLLLSLTLGLSYAAMRSLSTVGMIQRNSDRRASARQAAITGLSMALKKMHRSDWAGVDTSLSGSLGTNESFLVTYATGDPRINAGDPDQPYRVTLLSTGYAADPNQPASIAIYRARAVVRLIPRKLADEPADWSNMLNYTVFQWTFGSFTMTVPARIEGPVRIQATLNLDWNYPWWGNPRDRYHTDLNAMRVAGRGDYRPFTAQIALSNAWQSWDTISTLNTLLGVSTVNTGNQTVASMTFPTSLSTYCLYPGGKSYTIPQLPSTIQSAVYQSDATTNPAGLYFRVGALNLNDDTTIRGTVFTAANSGGRIYVLGKRVHLEPVNLPPLQGTTESVQLPVVVAGDTFRVSTDAEVTITGLISTYNSFEVLTDNQADITMSHQGKLIARDIYFNYRSDWYNSSWWWDDQYNKFDNQKGEANGIKYFPEWLQAKKGLTMQPRLTIKPDANPVRYHWHNPQNTIYVANPTDGGLRWDLLDWAENV